MKSTVRTKTVLPTMLVGLCLAWACSPAARTLPPAPDIPDGARLSRQARAQLVAARAAVDSRPDALDVRMQLAATFETNNLTTLAEQTLEQIVRFDPEQARAWYHLARLRDLNDDPQGGLEAFGQVARKTSTHAPLFWRTGLLHLELGQTDQAEAAFQRAIEIAPSDPSGHAGQARVALLRDDPAEAIRILEYLLERAPGDAGISQLLARALRSNGQQERAAEVAASARGATSLYQVDPWLQEFTIPRAMDIAELLEASANLLNAGRSQQALRMLLPALREHPGDVGLVARATGAYLQLGQHDRALELLDAADRPDRPNFRIEYNRGLVRHEMGLYPEAADSFSRATELAPDAAEAWAWLAMARAGQGRFDLARQALSRLVRLEADHPLIARVQQRITELSGSSDEQG